MKKERRKSMQGTVLFTTVSVMALLIIFLMGTLVLSSASNTRAHKTYSTSQASYTARAAIDAFIEAAARDTGIQAAITGLGDGGKIEADMVLSDPSLGEVGYVDQSTGNWVKDKIIIESVANDDVYEYLDDNNNQGANAKWVKLAKVKVTASVRVGKEIETVSALIKKRGSKPAVPPQTTSISPNIKGIQSLGDGYWPAGGRINGGLGVSLGDVDDPQGHLAVQRNKQALQTTLTFINSSVLTATSDFRILIHKTLPGKDEKGNEIPAETPFSQTVVTGNLYIPNNEFIKVDYKKGIDPDIVGDYELDYSKWTNKDVPYVFVDGALRTAGSYVSMENKNKSPFNLFAGTINGLFNIESANIYMMDPVVGNEPYTDASLNAKYKELHPDVYKVKNDQNNHDNAEDVPRGKNYLELNSENLYKWAESIENHSEVSSTALGGSIFCNGDLKINMKGNNGVIEGDIRVEGNLELEGNSFTVNGDVIVGGNASGFEKITVTAGHTKTANAKTSQGGGDTSNINITPIENKIVNEPLNQALLETVNPQFENLKVYYYEWVPSTHPKKHLDDNNTLITEYVDPWGKEITFSDTATDENGVPTEATRPIYYRWNDDFTANMFPANWENDWVNEVNVLDEYDKCDQNEHFKQIRTYLVDEKIITRPKNSYDDDDKYYYGVPKAIVAEDGTLQGYTATGRIADKAETYQYYPPARTIMTSEQVANYSTGVRKRHDINGQPTADDAGENEYTYYADADTWDYTEAGARQKAAAKAAGVPTTTSVIYPKDMTREAIYGKLDYDPDDRQVKFFKATDNKIITTVEEARAALGLDATGHIDYANFSEVIDSSTMTAEDVKANYTDKNIKTIDMKDSATKFIIHESEWSWKLNTDVFEVRNENGKKYPTIIASCTIDEGYPTYDGSGLKALNGTEFIGKDYNSEKEIWIDPKGGTINIVLKNIEFTENTKLVKVGSGTVNFIVDGTFKMATQNGGIFAGEYLHSTSSNPCKFDYAKDWGINFYGSSNSAIELSDPCTLMGSFRMPYTKFSGQVSGANCVFIEYTDENGQTVIPGKSYPDAKDGTFKQDVPYPTIVGNALFGEVSGTNDFVNFYTASGAKNNGNNTNTNTTVTINPGTPGTDAYWDVMYMSGS